MTRSKRLRILAEIYAKVPDAGCKGLCWESCTSVPVFPLELEQLEEKTGRKLEETTPIMGATLTGSPGATCPYLVLRRCTVYEARPLICRVFGVAEGLPCPHGCVPARTISDVAVQEMITRLETL
jgi:Fe-S-cluster containining protein